MGRLLSVAIAVGVAYVANARVLTLSDVPTNASSGTMVKRLYVDASRKPAMIYVHNFACATLSESSDSTSMTLVLAPAKEEKFKVCPLVGDGYANEAAGVHMFKKRMCGISSSHTMALAHSGTYTLYVVNCGGSPVTSTFQISGDINAHEGGFSLIFFIFLMFHVCLCAAWAVKQRESMRHPVTREIFEACVAAVMSHCAGFVSHFVSEPVHFVQVVHICLWSATISLTMVALITVSGVGCSAPGDMCRNAYFVLFFFVISAGLTHNGDEFDKYGNPPRDHNSKAEWATTWGTAGSFLVFGFICVRLLARSFRQQEKQQEIVAVLRKMAVVIAVYTGLGVVSATCIAYDLPSNESNSWGFHLVAGCVVTELTQSFGLGVTILMLWKTSLHTKCEETCYKSVEALPGDEEAIMHHTSSQDANTDAHKLQDEADCVVYGK